MLFVDHDRNKHYVRQLWAEYYIDEFELCRHYLCWCNGDNREYYVQDECLKFREKEDGKDETLHV